MIKSSRLRAPLATAAILFATVAIPLQTSGVAYAQNVPAGQGRVDADGVTATRLNIGVGKSVIVNLPREAAEIFVGNPRIANAVVRSSRNLYVIAMAGGQTTIFAMDKAGVQIARIEILVGRDIGELDRILKTAIPKSDITLRTVNDTIILTGAVESAGDAQKAMDIASGFVGNATGAAAGGPGAGNNKVINSLGIRGRDQVMLKVNIIEIQRQIVKQMGVTLSDITGNWGALRLDNPLSINPIPPSNTFLDVKGAFGPTKLASTIRAFERNGVARILAEPTVTAISGETAKFVAGGELPVPASSNCTAGSTCTLGVTFKPYGVTLNFTPVVVAEGRILLRVATEVTEIDPTTVVSLQFGNIPAMRTRKNETSVELPSGASIATAGLIQMKSRQVINGLPGAMNLPILGTLFRSRDYQREETELMIIVTPYISKPVAPTELARPTDGLQDSTDPQAWLLGRVNKIYSTTNNPHLVRTFRGQVGFIND